MKRISALTVFLFVSLLSAKSTPNQLLIDAANKGDIAGAKAALAAGADVNYHGESEQTALMLAAYTGNEKLVKLLIEANTEIDAVDLYGATALILASGNGNATGALKLLLKNHADLKIKDKSGTTPLMNACSMLYPNGTGAKILVAAGADVNEPNNEGYTPLMAVCGSYMHLSAPLVEYLIKKGAKADAQSTNGMTALMVSCGNGFQKAADVLIKYKASVNIQDAKGNAALHHCTQNCTTAGIVELLIKNGAKPSLKNNAGQTAFDMAKEIGNEEIMTVLKKYVK